MTVAASSDSRLRYSLSELVLYQVILLGTAVRLIVPFIHNPIHAVWSDPGRWWGYASTGVDTPPLALIDPLFYQAWISMVAKFTLDIPELTALYSGLLSAVTPWLWYRFLRELLPHKHQALLGWALLAWLPSWIGIYSYYMTETLLLPLLGAALWLSWRARRKRELGAITLAALVWTIAGLTRAIAGPMAAVVMLFVWWRQPKRLLSALAVTAVVLFFLLPLSYRSYVKTGMIAPLGQGAMNHIYAVSGKREVKVNYYSSGSNLGFLYGFASPSTGSRPFAPFSDYVNSREGTVELRIDLDDQRASWRTETQRVAEQAPARFGLVVEEMVFLFFGSSWPDNNPERWVEWINNWLRFIWLPLFLVAAGLLAYRWMQGERRHAPILLAIMLVWLVAQGMLLLSVNEGRYRKPMEGVVIAGLLAGAFYRRPREEGDDLGAPADGPQESG